jgi:hypothetical protein
MGMIMPATNQKSNPGVTFTQFLRYQYQKSLYNKAATGTEVTRRTVAGLDNSPMLIRAFPSSILVN